VHPPAKGSTVVESDVLKDLNHSTVHNESVKKRGNLHRSRRQQSFRDVRNFLGTSRILPKMLLRYSDSNNYILLLKYQVCLICRASTRLVRLQLLD
jgi:hypothetical protein